MITIERIGIDSKIALNTVSNMEISIKPNQHTKMILSGILDKNADSIHADWQGTNIRILELDHNRQPKDILFNGIIENTYVYAENGISQIIITALSASMMI